MTIAEAAKIVLETSSKTMTAKELVKEIEARDLFKFGAKQPAPVLASALRKKNEIFEKTKDGYKLK
tara:strand:+ start:259 stop:456 length:198 start_codon:yes stop_codon:yes gene_type:complete